MIILQNFELFVDKKTSKSGNDYCALFLKVGDKNIFINYITNSVYDYIKDLSK